VAYPSVIREPGCFILVYNYKYRSRFSNRHFRHQAAQFSTGRPAPGPWLEAVLHRKRKSPAGVPGLWKAVPFRCCRIGRKRCETRAGNGTAMRTDAFHAERPRFRRDRRVLALAAAAFAIAGSLAMPEASAQQAMGWLEIRPAPGRNMVRIVGHALALEKAGVIGFTMSVRRVNRGGSQSESRQAGQVSLAQGETRELSMAATNFDPGDTLTVELRIMEQGQAVFSTTMSATPPPDGRPL